MTATTASAPASVAPKPLHRADAVEIAASRERGCGYVLRGGAGLYRHDGPDALDLLHRISTNDLLSLRPGQARRTILTDERGRVIDAPMVLMNEPDDLMIVSDLENTRALERSILKYTIIEDACLTPIGSSFSRVTVFGETENPNPAADILTAEAFLGGDEELHRLKPGAWLDAAVGNIAVFGMPGLETFDLIFESGQWHDVFIRLNELQIPNVSADTFHTVRTRTGTPWPGHELTDAVNPLEVDLGVLVDFDKGCYVGQEVIARLDTYDKVQRHLVKLRAAIASVPDAPPVAGADLLDATDGRKVGWISSAAIIPGTNGDRWIGIGIVRKQHASSDAELMAGDIRLTAAPTPVGQAASTNP